MKLIKTFVIVTFTLIGIGCATKTQNVAKDEGNPVKTELLKQFNSDQIAQGKVLNDARCGRCHDLTPADAFTIEEWEPIIARMIPKAKLTEDEGQLVRAYLLLNAKS